MEFHQLRYVCAIADTGNFSRAAERCQITQPSLSQQVLKLEEELGTKLFDRLGRSIRLTEAGRAFIPRARTVLEQMEAARSSVADQNTDLRGSVAVGVIPTVAPYLIPSYAARFAKRYPDAKLRRHARDFDWRLRDYRTARKAAKVGIPAAAGVGAVAGGTAAAIALHRRRR